MEVNLAWVVVKGNDGRENPDSGYLSQSNDAHDASHMRRIWADCGINQNENQ